MDTATENKCQKCGATDQELHVYQHELYCVTHYNELKMAENLLDAAADKPLKSMVDLETEAISVRSQMAAVKITDQPSYNEAVDMLTTATGWLRNTREFFKSMKDPAYAAWKKICSNENLVCDPTEAGIKQIKGEIVRWDAEQERIRQVEQRRLEEVARKAEEETRLAEAYHMEEQGAPAEVVGAMLEEPIQVHTPVVAERTYEKSSAVTYRDNWGGTCDDLFKLVQFVAKNKQHLNLLQANGPAINQLAKALKESMAIPGIRAVNNKVVATGRSY